MGRIAFLLTLGVSALAAPALAQDDDDSAGDEGTPADETPPPAPEPAPQPAPEPEPAAAPAPEKPKAEVDLVAEFGTVFLWGNTKSISVNGKLAFAVQHDKNKFSLAGGGSFGRGVAADTGDWVTTASRVFGDLRYDRFLTDRNSLFVMGGAFHDPFAGFTVRASGNFGYSHLLVKTDVHELKAEGGFNYTFDRYVPAVTPRDKHFFGARLFAGYVATPSKSFGFAQALEGLFGGTDNVDARFDGRLTSATAVTANINSILGLKIGFDLNWDFVPPEGFAPVDTTTSLTLVATLM